MKIKIFIFSTLVIFFSLFSVRAASFKDAFGNEFLGGAGSSAGYSTSYSDPTSIISTIIQVALSFLGVIFLILMIYGGYLWMTASGNEQQVEKAKKLITAAVIGLIIVVSAYAISFFVMSRLGETTLTP